MESIMNFLNTYPELVYGLSVNILTWVIFKYILHSPSKTIQLLVLVSSGLVLGIIYSLITKVQWPIMILAFLASIGFYEIIIKLIMRKLKISYDKNK